MDETTLTPAPAPVAPATPTPVTEPPVATGIPTPTQTPLSTPPPQPVPSPIRGDGTFEDGWQNKIAGLEEYGAMLAQFKDMPSLAKAFRDNMTAARSKPQGLIIPGSDAPEDAKAAFQAELRKHWGVPESADGYKLDKPANLPQGVDWNDESAKNFAGLAHQMGLNPTQASALIEYDMKRLAQAQAAQQQEREALVAGEREHMKKIWGDKVDAELLMAKRLALTEGLPNANELFDPAHPNFAGVDIAAAFSNLARKLGEKNLVTTAGAANLTPENWANDVINNPNNPDYSAFRDANNPRSAEVRKRVEDAFKQTTGGR